MTYLIHLIKYATPSEDIVSEIFVTLDSEEDYDESYILTKRNDIMEEVVIPYANDDGYELQGIYRLETVMKAAHGASVPSIDEWNKT